MARCAGLAAPAAIIGAGQTVGTGIGLADGHILDRLQIIARAINQPDNHDDAYEDFLEHDPHS